MTEIQFVELILVMIRYGVCVGIFWAVIEYLFYHFRGYKSV